MIRTDPDWPRSVAAWADRLLSRMQSRVRDRPPRYVFPVPSGGPRRHTFWIIDDPIRPQPEPAGWYVVDLHRPRGVPPGRWRLGWLPVELATLAQLRGRRHSGPLTRLAANHSPDVDRRELEGLGLC